MRQVRWQITAALGFIGVLVGVFVLIGGSPPPPPGPPDGPRVLVAMGDSTISGEAAGDYDPATDGADGNWCHRSPHAAIHHTGLPGIADTVNLACSGAPSAQVALGDVRQYTESSQARRLGLLARDHRVTAILLAVGANDDPAFSHVLDACVRAWFATDTPGCAQATGPDWRRRVDAMVPKALAAITDIRTVMRDAGYDTDDYQLVIQSYAAPIGPDALPALRNLNGCPFRDEDLRWVRDTAVPLITDGVRRVARESGARFLDLSRAATGREACSRDDPTQEWFSRLSVRWDDLGDDTRATHALQESFHPNAAGHAAFGSCLGEFLTTTDTAAACLPGADGQLHPAASVGP